MMNSVSTTDQPDRVHEAQKQTNNNNKIQNRIPTYNKTENENVIEDLFKQERFKWTKI